MNAVEHCNITNRINFPGFSLEKEKQYLVTNAFIT